VLVFKLRTECTISKVVIIASGIMLLVYSSSVIGNYFMHFIFFQMSAYFAPAFFSHLLGKSLRRKHPIVEVLKLGLVVLGTFAAVWWPYLYSTQSVLEVTMLSLPGSKCICILLILFHIAWKSIILLLLSCFA